MEHSQLYNQEVIKIPFTRSGKDFTAIRIGSNTPFLQFVGVGTGSSIAASGTDTQLTTETGTRIAFTTTNFATAGSFNFTTFYNSVQLSGMSLLEFGVFSGSEGGSVWLRENFTPAITFTGEQELELDITISTF